jgi:phage terminase small subunit
LAAVRAAREKKILPPQRLDPAARQLWPKIIERRARDEWTPIDLEFAVELALVIAGWRRESQRLEKEGAVLFNANGRRPKANPRAAIVQTLSRRALYLATFLRLHPASDHAEPQKVRGKRLAEQAARELVAAVDEGANAFLPNVN